MALTFTETDSTINNLTTDIRHALQNENNAMLNALGSEKIAQFLLNFTYVHIISLLPFDFEEADQSTDESFTETSESVQIQEGVVDLLPFDSVDFQVLAFGSASYSGLAQAMIPLLVEMGILVEQEDYLSDQAYVFADITIINALLRIYKDQS